MKKFLIAISLCLVMLLCGAFVACGSNPENNNAVNNDAAVEETPSVVEQPSRPEMTTEEKNEATINAVYKALQSNEYFKDVLEFTATVSLHKNGYVARGYDGYYGTINITTSDETPVISFMFFASNEQAKSYDDNLTANKSYTDYHELMSGKYQYPVIYILEEGHSSNYDVAYNIAYGALQSLEFLNK